MKASTKAPAFQFYPKDWLSDERVVLMSPAARGCYIDLLCSQWLNHGSIPDDLDLMSRICRVPRRTFAKVWPEIKPCFAELTEGRLANPRLERQRAEQADFHEDKRGAGIASAEARRQKFGTAQPNKPRTAFEQPVRECVATDVEPPTPSPSPTPSPLHVLAHARDARDERFSTFWAQYPKKVGHGAARKAYQRLNPSDDLLRQMLAALEWQKQQDQWTRDGGQYIPHPATWLNQGRWEDAQSEAPAPTTMHYPVPGVERTQEYLRRLREA